MSLKLILKMKPRWLVLYSVTAVLFVTLLVYGYRLKSAQLEREARAQQFENANEELLSTKDALARDVKSAQELQHEIELELQEEKRIYVSLRTTLGAIQSKLRGSDRLKKAVATLEAEFRKLTEEAKAAKL